MSLTVKLILIALLISVVGYEQYWVYDQGRQNGQAKCTADGLAMLNRALEQQEMAFRALRQKEMREAAETAKTMSKNDAKRIKDQQRVIDGLKTIETAASVPVPADIISVLNDTRGYPAPGKV